MVTDSCRTLLAGLLFTLLCNCAPVPLRPGSKTAGKRGTARVTFYNKHEDRYGNRIASSKYRRACRGYTAAAERAFAFGTVIRIPWLARLLGTGRYVVEDRGSAVERRRASHGTTPVFDIYVDSKAETRRLAAIVPPYLPYEIE